MQTPSSDSLDNLYQQGATERTRAEVDQNILAMAKDHLKNTSGDINQSQQDKDLKSWRKRQWPASVAASVFVVSLLYWYVGPGTTPEFSTVPRESDSAETVQSDAAPQAMSQPKPVPAQPSQRLNQDAPVNSALVSSAPIDSPPIDNASDTDKAQAMQARTKQVLQAEHERGRQAELAQAKDAERQMQAAEAEFATENLNEAQVAKAASAPPEEGNNDDTALADSALAYSPNQPVQAEPELERIEIMGSRIKQTEYASAEEWQAALKEQITDLDSDELSEDVVLDIIDDIQSLKHEYPEITLDKTIQAFWQKYAPEQKN